jgi:hypothetical protein
MVGPYLFNIYLDINQESGQDQNSECDATLFLER